MAPHDSRCFLHGSERSLLNSGDLRQCQSDKEFIDEERFSDDDVSGNEDLLSE